MRWGLVPFFHKKPVREWKAATFNAKAETVKTLASFREPFRRRRCLIAADGWVEWKGEGKPKPKFYIAARDGESICFAGLWRSEEHMSELQSLMRLSYAVFCLKKK